MKKIFVLTIGLMIGSLLCGCRKSENIRVQEVSRQELANGIGLNLAGQYEGDMEFEILDAYVTDNPKRAGIDIDKIDKYSVVYCEKKDLKKSRITYPEYFEDIEEGKLIDDCRLFVIKIKATNKNAVSKWSEAYKNDYLFRADMHDLLIIENNELVAEKAIDYYSQRTDDEHTWCTFELKPGESVVYEVGYIIGSMVEGKATGDTALISVDYDDIYISGDPALHMEWRQR